MSITGIRCGACCFSGSSQCHCGRTVMDGRFPPSTLNRTVILALKDLFTQSIWLSLEDLFSNNLTGPDINPTDGVIRRTSWSNNRNIYISQQFKASKKKKKWLHKVFINVQVPLHTNTTQRYIRIQIVFKSLNITVTAGWSIVSPAYTDTQRSASYKYFAM